MKVLDLFSGIGGMSLGLERAGMETVAFCEIDPFCQKVLKKHWPGVPIFEDVRNLNYDGSVDLICGGYPCQPFSAAGKRKGAEDDRHLWPSMFELIKKHRPDWVIGENVAGHVTMGLDDVLTDLEGEDYAAIPFVVPACAVGAPHRRDRVWIVAHRNTGQRDRAQQEICARRDAPDNGGAAFPDHDGCGLTRPRAGAEEHDAALCCENASHTNRTRPQRRQKAGNTEGGREERNEQSSRRDKCNERGNWPTEPSVGRVAYGVPRRVDRLRALGNAVVPQVVEMIGNKIMELEK